MPGATLELSSIQFAFVGQLIAMGAVLWGLWKAVAAAGEKQAPVIESLRKEMLAKLDAEVANASKARHDMVNQLQVQFSRMENDVERLKRETVRREDMLAIEGRLSAQFAKIDTKVDALSDKLVPLFALEKQVNNVDNRLGEALRRIEQVNVAVKGNNTLLREGA